MEGGEKEEIGLLMEAGVPLQESVQDLFGYLLVRHARKLTA
jgi:hypothetical protein